MKIGVWQILPSNLYENYKENNVTLTDELFSNALNDGQPIVIYNHGNAGHRAAPHRVELYNILKKHFHIIAYDYRSK